MSLGSLLLQAAEPTRSFWLPPPASTHAAGADALFYFIYGISAFFFLLVVLTTGFLVLKYRKKRKDQATSALEGNRRLEIVWAVIPALLLFVVFLWGFRSYLDQSVPPAESIDVRVLAQRWSWSFDYPKHGISGATELVVPINRPVKLTMSAKDVIHSLYIPAFRIKKDLIPNRYSVLWFEPTREGTYDVMCAEYCGTGHSTMLSKVRVVKQTEYDEWIQSGGGGEMDGPQLFAAKACNTCHSPTKDRRGLAGPPLGGKYGSMEALAGGSQVKVDDNYIRESIVKPNAKVVRGYAPVMPTFAGQLSDKQINALIDYIKSLKE